MEHRIDSRDGLAGSPFGDTWELRATVMIIAGERVGDFSAAASQMSALSMKKVNSAEKRGRLSQAMSVTEVGSSSDTTKERKITALGLLSRS